MTSTTASAVLYRRVVALEPVPLFLAYLEWSAAANRVAHLVTHRALAMAERPGPPPLELALAKDGTYWGLASVDALNLHPHEGR